MTSFSISSSLKRCGSNSFWSLWNQWRECHLTFCFSCRSLPCVAVGRATITTTPTSTMAFLFLILLLDNHIPSNEPTSLDTKWEMPRFVVVFMQRWTRVDCRTPIDDLVLLSIKPLVSIDGHQVRVIHHVGNPIDDFPLIHRVQKSQFHRKPRVVYDETLLSSGKTHSHENSPMILCEIRHVSRIFIDFPKSPMNVHDFKRSTAIFIDVLVTSVFTGDQRTQFTCFHPWLENIDDHRWLSGYITRENQCHQNLQDHPWYSLFVMHDHWLFDVISQQRKLDSCSCGSTSFYWYPRASTRQFYKTFPTHLSRHRVRGWQWPVIKSRFELRSTQSTDPASNAGKQYRNDRENEATSQTTSLGGRFERISRRSCSTAPSNDCPSILAEYFATQTGFARSSRRTADCSRDNTLAETNAVRLLRRSLARQRSVRSRWCWRWRSCRPFACRERSQPLLLERAQYKWWNTNWSFGRSTATRWQAQIDSSVGAAGACLASNEKAVEEPMSTEVHATQAASWS